MYLERGVGLSLEESGGGGGWGWVAKSRSVGEELCHIPLPAIGWFTLIHLTLLPILSMIAISRNRKLQL